MNFETLIFNLIFDFAIFVFSFDFLLCGINALLYKDTQHMPKFLGRYIWRRMQYDPNRSYGKWSYADKLYSFNALTIYCLFGGGLSALFILLDAFIRIKNFFAV
jgi:hypothetical protein